MISIYNVGKDFTQCPAGRKAENSAGTNDSGEELRKILSDLIKTLTGDDILIIELKDTAGFALSFIDEVFFTLAEECGITEEVLMQNIIITGDEGYAYEAYSSIMESWTNREKGN